MPINLEFLKDYNKFISINGSSITFTFQSGSIKEKGINGCQIDELGRVWKKFLESFNAAKPCEENSLSIMYLDDALAYQDKRKNLVGKQSK